MGCRRIVLFVIVYGTAVPAACSSVCVSLHTKGLPAGVRLQYILPLYYLRTKKRALTARTAAVLRSILGNYTEQRQPAESGDGSAGLYCVPRLGTVSPWSSKASDVLHACGVSDVLRIERGDCYMLDFSGRPPLSRYELRKTAACLYDPLTQTASFRRPSARAVFSCNSKPKDDFMASDSDIDDILHRCSDRLGLGMGEAEHKALASFYRKNRTPTLAELVMYSQVNSEHCRHKIFNSKFIFDNEYPEKSMFEWVKDTYRHHPAAVVSAYHDNAAVVSHGLIQHHGLCVSGGKTGVEKREQQQDYLIKVETHNHPTAISPYQGAATGSGGEIRDEAAAGRGGEPAMGINGFAVSNLCIPNHIRSWEKDSVLHPHLSKPLDIMLQGPIGCAAYNNEFGRPALAGFFRTLECRRGDKIVGFHKPIMIAGGGQDIFIRGGR